MSVPSNTAHNILNNVQTTTVFHPNGGRTVFVPAMSVGDPMYKLGFPAVSFTFQGGRK
jgi:hypothetical protein